MRYCATDKYEIIQLVQNSKLSVRQTLDRLSIHKSTFYNWLNRYQENGIDGLEDKKPIPQAVWNKITETHRDAVVELALEKPELSPRELAVSYTDDKRYFISESSVYRLLKEQDLITSPAYILLKASDKFQQPTTHVNEMWQTDFTYFKIIGWGWYYLSTILDDYSRFIVSWRLCKTMGANDVPDTLDDALRFTGLDSVKVNHKPRLLSDNGPCYVSGELAEYLEEQGMTHTRGRPSMKNQILLDNYYFTSELEEQLQKFVSYYNHERYHESLNNLTPAGVFYGRGEEIFEECEMIKQNTMALRKQMHYDKQTKQLTQ